jgi:DNA (cytosine-5)-methyltransferase 1
MKLTVGSLFSGIGGFDLGLENAGMKVIWQSEIETHCCAILKKHWPDIPNLGDVKKINWSTIEHPDVLCGGYPCQPFSVAGLRKGQYDERNLWPYFSEAIRTIRPKYAIMENVRGHLSLGFKEVLQDLSDIGYDAEWQVIPASAVGAPQKRERLFIVAYPKKLLSNVGNNNLQSSVKPKTFSKPRNSNRKTNEESRPRWKNEPNVGRVADGIPFRVDRLKGLGNAIVPQVAQLIGERILASHESQ